MLDCLLVCLFVCFCAADLHQAPSLLVLMLLLVHLLCFISAKQTKKIPMFKLKKGKVGKECRHCYRMALPWENSLGAKARLGHSIRSFIIHSLALTKAHHFISGPTAAHADRRSCVACPHCEFSGIMIYHVFNRDQLKAHNFCCCCFWNK